MPKTKLSRREFLKLTIGALSGTAAASAGGYTYITRLEPGWLEITHLDLTLPRLPQAFDGYTIAQISDIHMDKWMTLERFTNIVELTNNLQPEIIALTGDFVSHPPHEIANDLSSALSNLHANDGVIAVLGNHDHWTNASLVRSILKKGGVSELKNSVISVSRGESKLHFGGIDDYYEKHDRLQKVIRNIPPNSCAILLAHEPDYADISAPTRQFDLQLSGHSHGGQVIIPFVGPIVLPKHGRKYPLGLYNIDDMLLYTNRGVGMVEPRVRFNCRPEITLFTLQSPITNNLSRISIL